MTASPGWHDRRVHWCHTTGGKGGAMTRDDLIAAAPWIIFGTGVCGVWIRLLHARHPPGHAPGRRRRFPASPGAADPAEHISGQETSSSPETQEAQCPKKN
jgi:hypothetical protein